MTRGYKVEEEGKLRSGEKEKSDVRRLEENFRALAQREKLGLCCASLEGGGEVLLEAGKKREREVSSILQIEGGNLYS